MKARMMREQPKLAEYLQDKTPKQISAMVKNEKNRRIKRGLLPHRGTKRSQKQQEKVLGIEKKIVKEQDSSSKFEYAESSQDHSMDNLQSTTRSPILPTTDELNTTDIIDSDASNLTIKFRNETNPPLVIQNNFEISKGNIKKNEDSSSSYNYKLQSFDEYYMSDLITRIKSRMEHLAFQKLNNAVTDITFVQKLLYAASDHCQVMETNAYCSESQFLDDTLTENECSIDNLHDDKANHEARNETKFSDIVVIDQESLIKKDLQIIYAAIDKKSHLRACLRECLDLNQRRVTRKTSEKSGFTETDLGKAQIGYGELRIGSFNKVLSRLLNLNEVIIENSQVKQALNFADTSYNINETSLFLDIGSGFGKPVIHTAYTIGCPAHGIEVVPARHQAATELLQELATNSKIIHRDKLHKVSFELINATTCSSFKHNHTQEDYTHIFSFNKVMGVEVNRGIAKVLNNTNFKVLIWTANFDDTTRKYGVKDVILIDSINQCSSTGSQNFTFYIYCKIQQWQAIENINELRCDQLNESEIIENEKIHPNNTKRYQSLVDIS